MGKWLRVSGQRFRRLAATIVAVTVALVAVACGGKDPETVAVCEGLPKIWTAAMDNAARIELSHGFDESAEIMLAAQDPVAGLQEHWQGVDSENVRRNAQNVLQALQFIRSDGSNPVNGREMRDFVADAWAWRVAHLHSTCEFYGEVDVPCLPHIPPVEVDYDSTFESKAFC